MKRFRRVALHIASALGVLAAFFVPGLLMAARNSSGTYSLPAGNPVVTGTTITTAWANSTLGDIGTELTNSLDRGGRGAMNAPLQLSSGAAAAPSLTFSAETNSGLYRNASNDVRMQVAGLNIQRWSTTGSIFPLATTCQAGLTVTNSNSNSNGIVTTGTGTGLGIRATGGATSGAGGDFTGGAPNGTGVISTGIGSGPGLYGQGGSTGHGLTALGGATGSGVFATGGGTGSGVVGTGGPTNGIGVRGIGTATGVGGSFVGGTSGAGADGVTGAGGASGRSGVVGTGGSTGFGVVGLGGATSGGGVSGQGTGTGIGGTFSNGTAATSGTRRDALAVTNGDISFAGVSDPAITTGSLNRLTPKNFVKAWGYVTTDGVGGRTVQDGFNLTDCTISTFTMTCTLATAMGNASYAVTATLGEGGSASPVATYVSARSTTQISFQGWRSSAGLVALNWEAQAVNISFQVLGAQ